MTQEEKELQLAKSLARIHKWSKKAMGEIVVRNKRTSFQYAERCFTEAAYLLDVVLGNKEFGQDWKEPSEA